MTATAAIALVLIFFIKGGGKGDGVSRATAFRQTAIVLGYDDNAEYKNYFPDESPDWFTPYLNFLYENEYLDEKITVPEADDMIKSLTVSEVIGLLSHCRYDFTDSEKTSQLDGHTEDLKGKKEKKISKKDWYGILDTLINVYEKRSFTEEKEMLLFATPSYIHELDAWNGVTDKGVFNFEGFAIDPFVDTKIKVTILNDKVIKTEPVEAYADYENVILYKSDGVLNIRLSGYERQFSVDEDLGEDDYVLADVSITGNNITKIKLKKEKISGSIHTVNDGYIDIEGYGILSLNTNVHIFKSFGDIKELTADELIIGYDIYEFIVADNQVCGIYMVREPQADKIRIVLSSSDYKEQYHDEVACSSESGLKIAIGDNILETVSGESFSVSKDSSYFNDGARIIIEACNEGNITVSSITRKNGYPSYPGKIELSLSDKGIIVINEVYLEDYLKLVLPSEMPSAFELEALKAQAVCARSYAYKHIQGGAYAALGAHVDDTTSFQVYNNADANENSSKAVDETYGKILLYQNEPVATYYYSTSWGYSTDISVWGRDISQMPYLSGIKLSSAESRNVQDNTVFNELIRVRNDKDWESECPWYRWNITLGIEELSGIINKNIPEYSLKKIQDIEVLQTDGSYASEYTDNIGSVKRMEILERGTGGVVTKLLIEGSEKTIILNKAGAVRNILGSKSNVYTKADGSTSDGQQYLPSGYFVIDENNENGVLTGYTITGGGFGHGIGMSQNGANELARQGMGYEDILKTFFPGTEIKEK